MGRGGILQGFAMKRNRKCPDPGVLKRLEETSVYKRASYDKLRGYYKSPSKRGVFVPLGKGTRTAVVQ